MDGTNIWKISLETLSMSFALLENHLFSNPNAIHLVGLYVGKENREKYKWKKRANAVIYEVANKNVLNELKPYLLKNLYPIVQNKIPNLLYDKNDVSINEETMNTLNEVISLMKQDPSLRIEIIGHSDLAEQAKIAQERIEPIIKQLIFKKIDAKRISTKNFGSSQPISKTERRKNQRIEIQLYTPLKKQLEVILNENNPNNLKVTEGLFEEGQNPILNEVEWKPNNYTLQRPNGKITYIEITEIKEPRLKDYEEARGFVITDYQKYLEKQWVKELKQKYTTEINETELKKMIK
jgi:peptidyl-prolyl cis-trans isomerase SurA